MTELKPCPYCKGEPYHKATWDNWQEVGCKKCKIAVRSGIWFTKDDEFRAFEFWNRRANDD